MITMSDVIEHDLFKPSAAVRPPHGETVMLFRPVNINHHRIVLWRVSPMIRIPHVIDWDRWPLWRYVRPKRTA